MPRRPAPAAASIAPPRAVLVLRATTSVEYAGGPVVLPAGTTAREGHPIVAQLGYSAFRPQKVDFEV